MMTSTENFRAIALDHAVRTTGGLATPEEVAKAAETYLAFLQGRPTKTENAAAEPAGRTVHVHFAREDPEREPGEVGRRRKLIHDVVATLRRAGLKAAGEVVEVTYGEVR